MKRPPLEFSRSRNEFAEADASYPAAVKRPPSGVFAHPYFRHSESALAEADASYSLPAAVKRPPSGVFAHSESAFAEADASYITQRP